MNTLNDTVNDKCVYRGTLGILLIVSSFLVLAVEMSTHAVSILLDQMVLVDRKMQVLNDIVDDNFYGLNTDMHLERSLIIILILGILLYNSSRKEAA